MNFKDLNDELLKIIPEIECDFNNSLNSKTICIIRALLKSFSPRFIRGIIHENPFLLNNALTQKLSFPLCTNNIQRAIVNELNEELYPEEDLFRAISFMQVGDIQTPLHMVTARNQNEELYKNVQLLINCGADVNMRNKMNVTPLHALCYRIDENMAIQSLCFVLERGTNAFAALQHENKCFLLDAVISNTKSHFKKLEAVKLLLEFGAKPDKNTLKQSISLWVSHNESFYSIRLVKLLMQYLLINKFKKNFSKVIKLMAFEDNFSKLCEMLDLSSFSHLVCYKNLVEYRNTVVKELVAMVQDKIDKKTTLFSFISERCSSGLTCNEYEEHLLYKVLAKLYSKHYFSCQDLFSASIKQRALLSVLFNTTIFVKIPSKIVTLDPYAVLYIASYLSRNDIVNLIHAFWMEQEEKKIIPVKRSLCDRYSVSFHYEVNEENSSHDNSVISTMPLKRIKLHE